jgi:hypothetical protein
VRVQDLPQPFSLNGDLELLQCRVQINTDRNTILASTTVDAVEVDTAFGHLGFTATTYWCCHRQSRR